MQPYLLISSILAPEVFATFLNKVNGYSYEVDWWSLGVTICEMIRGKVRTRTLILHEVMLSVQLLIIEYVVVNFNFVSFISGRNLLEKFLQNCKTILCR